MRGIIWYLDKGKAENKLQEILEYYLSIGYKRRWIGFTGLGSPEAYIYLEHEGADENTYWRIENANNPKWTKKYSQECFGEHLAYIDKNISKEFEKTIIIPMIKQSPFPAYIYY